MSPWQILQAVAGVYFGCGALVALGRVVLLLRNTDPSFCLGDVEWPWRLFWTVILAVLTVVAWPLYAGQVCVSLRRRPCHRGAHWHGDQR